MTTIWALLLIACTPTSSFSGGHTRPLLNDTGDADTDTDTDTASDGGGADGGSADGGADGGGDGDGGGSFDGGAPDGGGSDGGSADGGSADGGGSDGGGESACEGITSISPSPGSVKSKWEGEVSFTLSGCATNISVDDGAMGSGDPPVWYWTAEWTDVPTSFDGEATATLWYTGLKDCGGCAMGFYFESDEGTADLLWLNLTY